MIFLSNNRPDPSRTGRASALSLLLLISAGCFAAAEQAPPTASKATGILETSAGSYEFTPMTCAIHNEDGVDDIEIGGPGIAPDGEVFYFELSSTGNELSVNLGVNTPFANADRQFRAGRFISQEFVLEVSGATMSVADLVLVDENGKLVDDGASLSIDCQS